MSAQSIALWNALPMQPSQESRNMLKRSRPDYEQDAGGDDDNDVSIASRTPSPPPQEEMEVDPESLHKYDEYVRGSAREVITVETKIKPTNKGFAMLANMGWKDGQPLGLSGDGRVDPIPFQVKNDSTGLGKLSQDVHMIETTVSQRRNLDSERQHMETEDQRRAREEAVAKRVALEVEISSTLKAFYCSLCDKQFRNVAQYDEHTNSYAHHHKARARDMQANARIVPKEELDKRKEKERKREEKELRKMAAAIGIKLAKPPTAIPSPSLPAVTEPRLSEDASSLGSAVGVEHTGFQKSGWATVSTPAGQQPAVSSSSRGGWASVGSSGPTQQSHIPVDSGWNSVTPTGRLEANAVQPSSTYTNAHFRTGGWSSLDSNSVVAPPLTEGSFSAARSPPLAHGITSEPNATRSNWQSFSKLAKGRR